MGSSFNVYVKQINPNKLLVYLIFFILFFIYSFLEKPFVKEKYLQNDINDFEDNYFWKIYFLFCVIILILIFVKIKKSKEAIGGFILGFLFFLILRYATLNNFVTVNALYLNQIKSVDKEKIVYRIFNYDKVISLHKINNEESIFDDNIMKKIDRKRKINKQKTLLEIKHGDTVNVLYDKGLLGFKYLN